MPETTSAEETLPEDIDERPQRRREWSGGIKSVALPLLAVAAIFGAVWYLQGGHGTQTAKSPAGLGVVALEPGRNHSGKPADAAIGRAAPDFRLTTLDGRTVRLSDLQGKTVLINFWATWCLPCRQEMPEIVKAYAQYHDRGFEVMSVDEQEDDGTVQKWVNDFGMQFPVAMDRTGQVGLTFRAGTQFPTSLFVNPQGIVTDIKYGPMNKQFIEDHLIGLQ